MKTEDRPCTPTDSAGQDPDATPSQKCQDVKLELLPPSEEASDPLEPVVPVKQQDTDVLLKAIKKEESEDLGSTSVNGMHLPNESLIICGTASYSSRTMEQPQIKRKVSTAWEHFDLLSENKVKCRICLTELSYLNKSTSSMLRHYRARHEHGNDIPDPPTHSEHPGSRKQMLDEAVLNYILKDGQPFSIVESEGFREMLQVFDPSYVLPTKKNIKQMLARKHGEEWD